MDVLSSITKVTISELQQYGDTDLNFDLVGKFIDYGGQYKVFEYGENRVIKIPMTKEEIFCRISNWGHETTDAEAEYDRLISSRERSLKMVLDSYIPSAKLGNFYVHNKIILQDKVYVWNKIFSQFDTRAKYNFLVKLIDLYLVFWSFGLHETAHNFSLNCGISEDGNLVLIDFGEVTNDKNIVLDDLERGRIWKAWSAVQLPEKMHEFYTRKVNETLTVVNLERYWRVRI
jgi:hypothetical protein